MPVCGDGGGAAEWKSQRRLGPALCLCLGPSSLPLAGRDPRVAKYCGVGQGKTVTADVAMGKTRDLLPTQHKHTVPCPHPKLSSCFPKGLQFQFPSSNQPQSSWALRNLMLPLWRESEQNPFSCMWAQVYIHWSEPLELLALSGESPSPPSSDANSRTAAQSHTQPCMHPRAHMQMHRSQSYKPARGCPPCSFPIPCHPYSQFILLGLR